MYKAHTEEQFKEFMSQLVETNATLGFFSDFNKIAANVDAISIKLHQLNYLIGQEDMAAAIKSLWEENPKVFSVLDILNCNTYIGKEEGYRQKWVYMPDRGFF